MPLKENLWLCDAVGSPFILGIFKPRIYFPSNMAEEQIRVVLAHENAHLKRRDHFWKPFGYLLLSVYWFNPLCWLAYWLLCRDIEFACDEKVTKDLDPGGKKAYAEALLSCSVNHRTITACPLAFGEAGVKVRIKSVLRHRKPVFWVILATAAACIVTAVCLLTNPAGIKIDEIKQFPGASTLFENVGQIEIQKGNTFYTVNAQEEVEKLLRQIDGIRIYKNPISQNRSEDRDQTNKIVLQYHQDYEKTICFNENCDTLWVNDELKPTLTYRIKQPDAAKQLFDRFGSKAVGIAGQYQTVSCVCDCGFYSSLPPVGKQYVISQEMFLLEARNTPENARYIAWHTIGPLTEIQLTNENFDDLLGLTSGWKTGCSPSVLRKNNGKTWRVSQSRKGATEVEPDYYVLLQKDGSVYLSVFSGNTNSHIRCILKMQPVQTSSDAGGGAGQAEDACLSYIYAGCNDPFFWPGISLYPKEKTFQFTESLFSSYITIGIYELTDKTLTLQTYDGTRKYVFGVNQENNSFIYDAANSYGMPTYGSDSGDHIELRPMIPDGAEFIAGSWAPYEE